MSPQLGPKRKQETLEALLSKGPSVPPTKPSVVEWVRAAGEEHDTDGIFFKLEHPKVVKQATWHHKGDYLATVMPEGVRDAVYIHSIQRQHSQNPFSAKNRDIQRVAFHPSQPIFFVASKTSIRVYNLKTQTLMKRLNPGCKWISNIAVHPAGLLGGGHSHSCHAHTLLSCNPSLNRRQCYCGQL